MNGEYISIDTIKKIADLEKENKWLRDKKRELEKRIIRAKEYAKQYPLEEYDELAVVIEILEGKNE